MVSTDRIVSISSLSLLLLVLIMTLDSSIPEGGVSTVAPSTRGAKQQQQQQQLGEDDEAPDTAGGGLATCPKCPPCKACKKCAAAGGSAPAAEKPTTRKKRPRDADDEPATALATVEDAAAAGGDGGGAAAGTFRDWLGGKDFQAAALTVKKFEEPGEWILSDKTSQPMNHHSYETIYEKYFGIFKYSKEWVGKKVRLLEIGMGPKGSAKGYRLYKAYLGPKLEYVGFEYTNQEADIRRQTVLNEEERTWLLAHTYWGDQGNERDRRAVTEKWGPYDVIIDDGSHNNDHQVPTFKDMFLNSLKPGGVYIVEDIETSFMAGYSGGTDKQRSHDTFVTFTLDLMAALHFHWYDHHAHNRCADPSNPFGQEMNIEGFRLHKEIVEWIATIDCDREICAFRKRQEKLVPRRKVRDTRC